MTESLSNDSVRKKPQRVCPECGADSYRSRMVDRYIEGNARLRRQNEKIAAENGVLRAALEMADIERQEEHGRLQRKVIKQSRVIRRLEQLVRKMGGKPYNGVALGETAPVEQSGEVDEG